jgi:hypothetical protein
MAQATARSSTRAVRLAAAARPTSRRKRQAGKTRTRDDRLLDSLSDADLEKMSGAVGTSLVALYDAYEAAAAAFMAVKNQPRASGGNCFSDQIESEYNKMLKAADQCAEQLLRMPVTEETEQIIIDERARVLVEQAFRCGRSLPEALTILANAGTRLR